MKRNTKGFKMLANAIILKAVEDYRSAKQVLDNRTGNILVQSQLDNCERFFRSDWFKELTDIDGEYLIQKLRNE